MHPLNGMCFWSVLLEKKVFRFAKRALRAGTARNKWLKYALADVCMRIRGYEMLIFCKTLLTY